MSAVFGYSIGGQIYNYSRQEYDSDGTYTDRNQMKLHDGWNRWEKPGDIATHPVAKYNNSDKGNSASSRYLEDSDYLKLRSLSLGYNFNLKQYGIQNLRVSLSGENLFTLTDYSGVDPEIPASSGSVMGYPNMWSRFAALSRSFALKTSDRNHKGRCYEEAIFLGSGFHSGDMPYPGRGSRRGGSRAVGQRRLQLGSFRV